MELEGRRGRGTKEQREEERGGGREGSRTTAFYFKDLFFALQHADKNGVGLWTCFLKYVRLLMYSLQLSIQLSDIYILKLEPMAARET